MPAQESQPGLEERSVVSCFIFSPGRDNPQVALFRRSEKVHTYRHHRAPISGSIKTHESPLAAAWRELEEETSLTTSDAEIWRQGKPYAFEDTSVGRRWTVYPIAFRLKDPGEGGRGEEAIQIDWEHDGWEWYDPVKVAEDAHFVGVPRLAESLQRVYFEIYMNDGASKILQSSLEELKADHQSGSHELTSIALKAFRDVLVHLRGDVAWWKNARMAAWHLWKNGRESMGAATLNALLGVLADIDDLHCTDLSNESRWDRVLAVVDHHLQERQTMPSRIRDSFTAYLQDRYLPVAQSHSGNTLTLLTLSASSTIRDSILDAFATLPIPRLDLRILESRPLFEGASMASSLLSEFESKFPSSSGRQLALNVYTDASAALASPDVDFVLLGADRISGTGQVSNKVGSLPAVLSAKHASTKVKILVPSQLEKVAEPGGEDHHQQEENDRMEVMSCWLDSGIRGVGVLEEGLQGTRPKTAHCAVNVRNVYFEWIPAGLIDAYICEEGTLNADAIQTKAQQVKEKAERYLGSL
ncbi:uncharacterized protein N7459_005400 [Penicillium hispanicum]|uniref:uncharacterized protein n=1 Tax=Penicillium hispanicum TaxID=1080232 RepID=UPI0025419D54|nr:uncharacterized protein N7459_005400 [Penicillium hispanicum]KAJ5585600.1 hypothetical protein N7459_005400 [Penicillium hispanicum]